MRSRTPNDLPRFFIAAALVAALSPAAFAKDETPDLSVPATAACTKALEVLLSSDAQALAHVRSSAQKDEHARVNDGFAAMKGAMSFGDDVITPAADLYSRVKQGDSKLKTHLESYFQYLSKECTALAETYPERSMKVAKEQGTGRDMSLLKFHNSVQHDAFLHGGSPLYPTAYLVGDTADWGNSLPLMELAIKRAPSNPVYERIMAAKALESKPKSSISSQDLYSWCAPAAESYLTVLTSIAPTDMAPDEALQYWAGSMTSTMRMWSHLTKSIKDAERSGETGHIVDACSSMAKETAIAQRMTPMSMKRDKEGKPLYTFFTLAMTAPGQFTPEATNAPNDFPGFAANSYLTGFRYLPDAK